MSFISQPKRLYLALGTAYFISLIYLAVKEQFQNYYYAGEVLLRNGLLIGGDFPIFYVAGKLFRDSRVDLYNLTIQLESLRELAKGTRFSDVWLVFVYPPPIAALFSIFATSSLFNAYFAWLTVSVAIFSLSSYLLIRTLKVNLTEKYCIFISGVGFIPFIFNCLGAGQLAVIGMLIFSLAFIARKKGSEWVEGFVLGFGFYKPPLFLFFGALALAERRWRVVCGALCSGGLLLAASYLLVGKETLLKYFLVALNYRYGQEQTVGVHLPPFRGVGLYALLSQSDLTRGFVYLIFTSIFVLAIGVIISIKRMMPAYDHSSCSLIYSAEISCSVLFSIQCINYDLTLILPALYLVAGYILSHQVSRGRLILIALFILFHAEWMLRTNREGVEYAPIVPLILVCWPVAILIELRKSLGSKCVT